MDTTTHTTPTIPVRAALAATGHDGAVHPQPYAVT